MTQEDKNATLFYIEALRNEIDVMEAYLDGKTIEHRVRWSDTEWEKVENPTWDWDYYEYQVSSENKSTE